MTRTSVAVIEQAGFPEAGTTLSWVDADTVDGNSFVAANGEVLFARNTGASTRTVQFSYHRRGQLIEQGMVSILAGDMHIFGPFAREMLDHVPADPLVVHVLGSHTDVEFAVRRQIAGIVAPDLAPSDYIAYWRFNDGSGAPLDSSVYAHHWVTSLPADWSWIASDDVVGTTVEGTRGGYQANHASAGLYHMLDNALGNTDPPGLSISFWFRRVSQDSGVSNSLADFVLPNNFNTIARMRLILGSDWNGAFVVKSARIPNAPAGDGSYVGLVTEGGDSSKNALSTKYADNSGDLGWHHYVVTWNKSDGLFSLYEDGVLTGSFTGSTDLGLSTGFPGSEHKGIQIENGSYSPGSGYGVTLRWRDIQVFGRAVTAGEASAIYDAGMS